MLTLSLALSPMFLLMSAETAQPTSAPADPPKKARLVCRTQENTGSRVLGKRICYTKERWAEIEAESMAAVRDFQRDRGSLPTND